MRCSTFSRFGLIAPIEKFLCLRETFCLFFLCWKERFVSLSERNFLPFLSLLERKIRWKLSLLEGKVPHFLSLLERKLNNNMDTPRVKEYLANFQQRQLPVLTLRDLKINQTKKIKTIIGPRRAGKTFFIYQQMRELLKSTPKEELIFLNFEDPQLIGINFKEIPDLVKLQWQMYPSTAGKSLVLFVDEPQNIKNWEVAIRGLYDRGFDIYITGSSSKLLSKEISTSLRGRSLTYLLLPFSFKEFLKIKGIEFNAGVVSSKDKAILMNSLDEYSKYGGFPEIVKEQNQDIKLKILAEYLDSVVYKDIVDRFEIKNTKLIKWLINAIVTSFSKEISINKIYLTLKAQGIRVGKNTLYAYASMLEDVFFVFFVPKFSRSIRKREFSTSKAYLCDVGYTRLVGVPSESKGRIMENIVFLELVRRKNILTEIFYWKNEKQQEVDFVISEKTEPSKLIQVCADVSNDDTKEREVKGLLAAMKVFGLEKGTIITDDFEGEELVGEKKIQYLPLWNWLLK